MHCGMKYIVKVQFGESTLFVPLFRFFLKRGAPNWAEPTKKHSKKLSYTSNVILAYFSKSESYIVQIQNNNVQLLEL